LRKRKGGGSVTVRLKVIAARSADGCGCACACSYYNTDGGSANGKDTERKDCRPGEQQNARVVDELVQVLKDRWGDRLAVSVVEPGGVRALWDIIRYRVPPSVPVWVLNGKKIFEGVPDLAALQDAISACAISESAGGIAHT
jgi:hypothetical protein